MRKKHSKLEHVLLGTILIIAGIATCASSRIGGGYRRGTGIYRFPIEGQLAVIVGLCSIAMGLWAFYPLIKGAIRDGLRAMRKRAGGAGRADDEP